MLALLTQRLAEKIFARQHSGRRHVSPVHCSLCCNVSPQPHLKAPPTLHAGRRAARKDAHAARWVETPSKPPDEKTPPHKRPLLMQGEALLFSRTMSVLTFLCLHIFKHQKQQKEGRERERKKEVRQACKHNHWHVQTYTRSRYLLNTFLFSNHVDLLHILWSG